MMISQWTRVMGLLCMALGTLTQAGGCAASAVDGSIHDREQASTTEHTREDAIRMIGASEGRLAPVYTPLAEHLVRELTLADNTGIGIDLGSGPGTLVIELCRRTRMHWINADINPHFFPHFFREANECGCAGQVSAIRADAKNLPFRDNYADAIVSRGSFWLWGDKVKAFSEVLRVLKPGATAYIGRGLSENLPLDVAKAVRGKKGGPKYDVAATADELRGIMESLGVEDYRVIRPHMGNAAGVNYGVWVEFRKP